jgi:hypothetical protein
MSHLRHPVKKPKPAPSAPAKSSRVTRKGGDAKHKEPKQDYSKREGPYAEAEKKLEPYFRALREAAKTASAYKPPGKGKGPIKKALKHAGEYLTRVTKKK